MDSGISSKIEKLRSEKNISLTALGNGIGMTHRGIKSALEVGDFKVSTLLKIADFFGVPITYFFDDKGSNELDELIEGLKKQIEFYENLVNADKVLREIESGLSKKFENINSFLNFVEWFDVVDVESAKKTIEARLNYKLEIKPGIKLIDLQKYYASFNNKRTAPYESIYHCIDADKYMKSDLSKDFNNDENTKFINYITKLKEERDS